MASLIERGGPVMGSLETPPRRTVHAARIGDLVEIAEADVAVVCVSRRVSPSVRAFASALARAPHRGRTMVDAGAPELRELEALLRRALDFVPERDRGPYEPRRSRPRAAGKPTR